MRELDRLKCIQGLIDKQIKQKAVAERLGLTVRQVRRLVERYELEGPRGLISRLRDRPGNRRLKPERGYSRSCRHVAPSRQMGAVTGTYRRLLERGSSRAQG